VLAPCSNMHGWQNELRVLHFARGIQGEERRGLQ
jgi:hypothetical protein